jgi:hypothetical protein
MSKLQRHTPSADEIAARAHELFISGGRRIALIPEYWRAAGRELCRPRSRQTRPATSPAAIARSLPATDRGD